MCYIYIGSIRLKGFADRLEFRNQRSNLSRREGQVKSQKLFEQNAYRYESCDVTLCFEILYTKRNHVQAHLSYPAWYC